MAKRKSARSAKAAAKSATNKGVITAEDMGHLEEAEGYTAKASTILRIVIGCFDDDDDGTARVPMIELASVLPIEHIKSAAEATFSFRLDTWIYKRTQETRNRLWSAADLVIVANALLLAGISPDGMTAPIRGTLEAALERLESVHREVKALATSQSLTAKPQKRPMRPADNTREVRP